MTHPATRQGASRMVVFEEYRAKSRAQGQRDKARDDGRCCDRDGKLPKEKSGYSRQKSGRNEDGTQRECDRDQRSADFVHGLVSGVRRRDTLAHVALDVFDNNDRVVDDDANRENQAKKRQVVQRYPEWIENRERPDEGDGNCNNRDNRGSPILKKQEHHAEHEKDGNKNCDDHLADRFGDEGRRIVNDFVIDALRELFLEVSHRREDLMVDRKRVCARLRVDQERRRVTAIHVRSGSIIRGTNLDSTDVAHTGHPSLLIGFDDDVTELLGCRKPAEGLDVDLVGLAPWNGRLIQKPSRDLQVLGAQRREHLTAVEIVRRDLVRFEPDAHGVLTAAQELHISDTLEARENILYVQGCVV